jgi:hypothetical protein
MPREIIERQPGNGGGQHEIQPTFAGKVEHRSGSEESRKVDQGDLKRIMKEMDAKMDANQAKADGEQEEMLARMREDIKCSQAEIRSILCTFRSQLKEIIQRETRAAIQSVRSELDETTACREATETEPDPGMMQSKEEHQDILKVEAAVIPTGGPKKGSRVHVIWPRSAARRRRRKGPGEAVDPGGNRLPPAGSCPAVQKWHGEK